MASSRETEEEIRDLTAGIKRMKADQERFEEDGRKLAAEVEATWDALMARDSSGSVVATRRSLKSDYEWAEKQAGYEAELKKITDLGIALNEKEARIFAFTNFITDYERKK